MGVIIGPAIGGYLAQVSDKDFFLLFVNHLDYLLFTFSVFLPYYQPVKQYPHLFHEKSVFAR